MTTATFSLQQHGIDVEDVIRNPSVSFLYEAALRNEEGSAISATGALIAMSGEKTGRSPADKRIVDEPGSTDDVWWGPVNFKLDQHVFEINRERAIDYLNTRKRLYCIDAFAGWDPKYQIKVRIVCARAYHALFMHNMLIRPTEEELDDYGRSRAAVVAGKLGRARPRSACFSDTDDLTTLRHASAAPAQASRTSPSTTPGPSRAAGRRTRGPAARPSASTSRRARWSSSGRSTPAR